MQRVTPDSPFDWLTPERQHCFKSGVQSFNIDHPKMLEGRRHLHNRMSPMKSSLDLRFWLDTHVEEALSADDDIISRCIHNMDCYEIGGRILAYMFKLELAIDVENVVGDGPFPEPEIIRRARIARRQPYLMPPTADEDDRDLPLSDLHIIGIGYFVTRGQVAEMYFIDQDTFEVKDVHALGLMEGTPAVPSQFTMPVPRPKFVRKDGEESAE